LSRISRFAKPVHLTLHVLFLLLLLVIELLELTLPIRACFHLLLRHDKLLSLWLFDYILKCGLFLLVLKIRLKRSEVRLVDELHGVKTRGDKKCLLIVDVGSIGKLLIVYAVEHVVVQELNVLI
jgi:hypothetical protein